MSIRTSDIYNTAFNGPTFRSEAAQVSPSVGWGEDFCYATRQVLPACGSENDVITSVVMDAHPLARRCSAKQSEKIVAADFIYHSSSDQGLDSYTA